MSAVCDIIAAMRGEYMEDCRKRLADLRDLLDGLDIEDVDRLHEIERHAHAIKGSAFTFGLPEMSLICGTWEGEMKLVREGKRASPDDPGPWHRFAAMFSAFVDGSSVTATPGDSLLIWSPFEDTRSELFAHAHTAFARIETASTDSEALRTLAHQSFSAVLTTDETDSELDHEQRANLLVAVTAGTGTALLVRESGDDGASILQARGAIGF